MNEVNSEEFDNYFKYKFLYSPPMDRIPRVSRKRLFILEK